MNIDMRYPLVANYNNDDGVESYTNGAACGKAMSGDISVETEDNAVYCEGGERADLGKFVTGGKLKIDVTRVALQIRAMLGGHLYEAATTGEGAQGQKLSVKAGDTSKEVGYAFAYTEIDEAKEKHHYEVIIPRIVFASPADKYKSKGKQTDYQNPSLEGEFLPNVADMLYYIQEFPTIALARAHGKSFLGVTG